MTEEATNSGLESTNKKISVKQQLKAVVTEKYWWLVIIFYLLFQVSGAFKNLSITYFCSDHFAGTAIGGADGSGAMTIINVLGAIPMAIAMAFIWILSAKFGKRIVCLVGCLIAVYGVGIGVALKSFGSAPACYMILALIADVLDHIEAKNGYRCDGLTMSIYSSLMAASTPVATGIFNAISKGGALETANTISYIWIETVAYAICAVIMIFFVVERYLESDKEKILERQKAESIAAGIDWISPEEKLRMEEEEADRVAEEARKEELRTKCLKKGLDFEAEEAKYQTRMAEKRRIAEEKAKRKLKK